jgi:hypothetical protein
MRRRQLKAHTLSVEYIVGEPPRPRRPKMTEMDAATRTMIDGLKGKTGKTLEAWQQIVSASGKARHGEIVNWLKAEHGVTHGYANLIAHLSLKTTLDHWPPAVRISSRVSTAAPSPRCARSTTPWPQAITAFGADVELAPKKQYVSARRSKQFAIIQPSTATRVDVGLNLKGEPTTDRLEASGSFNSMVTHRVRVARPEDVDGQLLKWLRKAYDGA